MKSLQLSNLIKEGQSIKTSNLGAK